MPKTTKSGDAKADEIPSTLRRSDEKAQRTFAKAHDSAQESYGDERRANQVAWAAVKHTHEKIGDHWEPKDHKGPSDAQAEGGRDTDRETKGGVDANATKGVPDGRRQAAGRQRPLEDDQGRAGRRHPEGQRPEDRGGAQEVTRLRRRG